MVIKERSTWASVVGTFHMHKGQELLDLAGFEDRSARSLVGRNPYSGRNRRAGRLLAGWWNGRHKQLLGVRRVAALATKRSEERKLEMLLQVRRSSEESTIGL